MAAPLPHGLRLTRQRRALLRLVDGWTGAFTVAELHARARRDEPGIGLATVYRTLELLRTAGAVRLLSVAGRSSYVRCREEHHHHLVCTSCGAVEDTDLCAAPSTAEIARRHGFAAAAHDLDIYGTCRRCAA